MTLEMISLLLYWAVYMFSAFMLTISKLRRGTSIDIFFVVAIIVPVLLAALRYDVGTDYDTYAYMYSVFSKLSLKEWIQYQMGFDGVPFFLWLTYKIGGLFKSFNVFLGIISLATYCPMALLIKRKYTSEVTFILTFSYLAITFTNSFNGMKQGVAIAFVLYGLNYIFERRLMAFLITVLIAMLFHPTAFVAFPMYFLWRDPQKQKKNIPPIIKWGVYAGTLIVVVFFRRIVALFPGRFASYAMYSGEIGNKVFYLELLIFTLIYIYRRRLVRINENNSMLISGFLIGIMLGITGFYSPPIKRIAAYYTCVQYQLLSQIPLMFRKKDRLVISFMVGLYIIVLSTLNYLVFGHAEVLPYQIKLW